jgi:selenium donor protein
MDPIYLDYNATTPIDPRVFQEMRPYLEEHFGNPSSSHFYGLKTKKAVEKARKQVAELIGCEIDELIFTSGGTESNNYAIKGVVGALRDKGNHIITSAIEHPAVIEVCRFLENHGINVTEETITNQTILISIMHANNEVGTIQPIREIAKIAAAHGILLHSDCAQSVGKVEVKVDQLKADLLSIAGHKLYAPKGIGALYIRAGIQLEKLIHGANHEMDWRAGTENVLHCVGLGKACELISNESSKAEKHLKKLRDRLEHQLKTNFPEVKINGNRKNRLPNTLSISFPNIEANTIVSDLTKVAASAGAACHSDQVNVSPVLQAMGVPIHYAMGTIRFSVGRFTTSVEIDEAVKEITRVINQLKPGESSSKIDIKLEQINLTEFTHGLGCACKLQPQFLEDILKKMPLLSDPNILVGFNTADDAAVYRLDENLAVVQTVDFFTPIVDNPFQFGAISAANALSDLYAMGAKPLFALNIVGFPSNRLPLDVLKDILNGAQNIADKAGISIIGGHSIDDIEPKYGLAVTGIVHPDKILSNANAKVGDVLILTKPIGTGILTTALKRRLLDKAQESELVTTMMTLNQGAAKAIETVGANSCTDVTGFGLMGHLLEMMNASKTSAKILSHSVTLLSSVKEFAAAGIIPGGTLKNYEYTTPFIAYSAQLTKNTKLILNDAQTNGGLLISISRKKADKLIALLKKDGININSIIGEVISPNSNKIIVE